MERITLQTNGLMTISWLKDRVIDWGNSGRQYLLNGQVQELGSYYFAFPFDSAITSDNGVYSAIYQNLGTKGLLLKNGKILREINRSYYQADVYEYPIAFATLKNGKTYLIHCPNEYCQLDLEEVETGEIVTQTKERKPSDFFHSRLEVSPDNKTLISKGWGWHPFDFVELFDIDALSNPLSLDKSKTEPSVAGEICAASFINNDTILIGSPSETEEFEERISERLGPGQIATWNIRTNTISKPVNPDFIVGGHLTPINETYAWDLFDFPKIINYNTGKIVEKIESIFSGKQKSSIISAQDDLPKISFNRQTKQVAIASDNKIEILSP